MAFTRDQLHAIRSRRRRILVSAGAGSGKTAVLAARVLSRIREGIDVDKLVVLSFTNAAAAEMRARIRKQIESDAALKDQLPKLDNAVISTFDAFALRIVRQNHHLLGLPADVRIADSAVLRRLEETTLADVVLDRYRDGDPGFLSAVDRVWNGNDDGFAEAVRLVAAGMRQIPDADAWLAGYDRDHYSDIAVEGLLGRFSALLKRRRDDLRAAARAAADGLSGFAHPKAGPAAAAYAALAEAFPDTDYRSLRAAVSACKVPATPAKAKDLDEELAIAMRSAVAPFRRTLGKAKKWFESFYAENEQELAAAWNETRSVVTTVLEAVADYRTRLSAAKRNLNLFGFDDVTAFAIALLERVERARERCAADIVEIMVDEYQDTNDLQDRLVELLSAGSVFMVGDVKQSIYGFRDANPGNFIRKCRAVENGGDGDLIRLSDNFRSRSEVLHAVNVVFTALMDEPLGGVDYRAGESLTAAREKATEDEDFAPAVIAYDPGESAPTAVEADLLVRLVAAELAKGTRVTEKTEGGLVDRPCRAGDFCVLVDRKTDFDVYRNAFVAAGIPAFAVADERFLSSTEILFVLSILRLVRCETDPAYAADWFRHSLYAAARSFVYRIRDDIALPLVADRGMTGFGERILPAAFTPLRDLVRTLSAAAADATAPDFLARLYDGCDIYRHAATLPEPESAEARLDHLLEKAAALPAAGFAGLFDYISGIESSRDLDIEYAKPVELRDDAVTIMTMHKSKGLEFPFCLYPGLSKRFNRADTKGFFLFDLRFGLVTKAFDRGFKDTFVHALLRDAVDRDMVSERIRLLYVAMTRTREKMFFLADARKDDLPYPPYDASGTMTESHRLGAGSFADLLRGIPALRDWRVPVPTAATLPRPTAMPAVSVGPVRTVALDLRPRTVPTSGFAKRAPTLPDSAVKAALAVGTRFHAILESIDFKRLEPSLARLEPEWRIRVLGFLSHPELAGWRDCEIRQELAFIDGTDATATRGTIDLLLLGRTAATIVDYKLSRIDDPAYAAQLRGYRDYVARMTGLPVRTYLYSINDDRIVETGETQP
ncbi:MAG: UvrD-helicase domain-containing protein [Candidatus Izemoplasmatales bacterium]